MECFLDGSVFDGETENPVLFVASTQADHVFAVESLADGQVWARADFGVEVPDIVPEPAGECVAGGRSHDDAGALGELEPEQQANEGGVKGFGAGGGSGPCDPVVRAEALEGAIDPGVPDDAGVLPDELDSGLAMGEMTTADTFRTGVEMALERGGTAGEREAFEGIVGWAGLFHDQCW